MREGKLGCPVCSRSYPIVMGTARFIPGGGATAISHVSSDDPMRYAAMLGLVKPGAFVVMEGVDTATATAVAELTDSRVMLMNASLHSEKLSGWSCTAAAGYRWRLALPMGSF